MSATTQQHTLSSLLFSFAYYMALFKKTSVPILSPLSNLPWASGAVFNPGVCYDDGIFHMLFRAVPKGYKRFVRDAPAVGPGEPQNGFENYTSYIGYAWSEDGVNFTIRDEPFIAPDAPFDLFGAEDPRISKVGDRFYITYSALSTPAFGDQDGVRIALASTKDFSAVEKHGVVGPPLRDKDAVIFPQSGSDGINMLHRIHPDVQIVKFSDHEQLIQPSDAFWREHMETLEDHVILRPEHAWEATKIGMGPPPVRTGAGWLLIYHGVDEHYVYRAGVVLTNLEDPTRIIARTREPVLMPELDFERYGDVDNVVFPEGAALLDDNLHVYYGAADRTVGHAVASLKELLDLLHEPDNRKCLPRVYFSMNGQQVNGRRSMNPQPLVPCRRMNDGRPLLEPAPENSWESGVVLNPASVAIEQGPHLEDLYEAWQLPETERQLLREGGGACVMLYRAQGEGQPGEMAPSYIGLAVFTPDLQLVHRWVEPVMTPDAPFHNLGVEDSRCTRVGDTYVLYYTGYSSQMNDGGHKERRIQVCMASTKDFLVWTLHGPVSGDVNDVENKNATLFPEKINGKWRLLHRPMAGRHPMAIHLATSDTVTGPFRSEGVLMSSYRYQEFAISWVGAAGPPLALGNDRFLMIYHQGHFDWSHKREYNLSAALLDFKRDDIVQSRIEPLMRPMEGADEQVCHSVLGVDNVVFACANYRWGNDLIMPYAGADSRIFGCRFNFNELVGTLETL